MSDDDLAHYIQHHGDRLRLRAFLKRSNQENKIETRRGNLLTILRGKIEARNTAKKTKKSKSRKETMRNVSRQFGNRNANKVERKIKIGWIHKTAKGSVQVRTRQGGGTRENDIMKMATKKDILEMGQNFFFPDGKSSKGLVSQFNFDVWDFEDHSIREDMTVGDMYESTKKSVLSFYIATSDKPEKEDTDDVNGYSSDESLIEIQIPKSSHSFPPRETGSDDIVDQLSSSDDLLSQAIHIAGIEPDIEMDEETEFNSRSPRNVQPAHEPIPNIATCKTHSFKLHRGHVLKELIDKFKTVDPISDTVSIEIIFPNGELEAAADDGGVTRDTICEFWNSFYEECTLGGTFKVPCLRHDYGEAEFWFSDGE
jgi:hypothetical protein